MAKPSKMILLGILSILWITPVLAQSGDTAWVRRYDGAGSGHDVASAIALDGSGNVYVAGMSYGGSETGYDYATIKYDSDGDTSWIRRYDGMGHGSDSASAIALDGSGNVYVTGRSDGGETGFDYVTIKYYPNGDTAWVRRYDGWCGGNDEAYAIAVDTAGNIYVTGTSSSGFGPYRRYTTMKYSANGDAAWVSSYNRPGDYDDSAYDVAVDDLGNVYVTGTSWGSGTFYDLVTIKHYASGDTAWVRRFNGTADFNDVARAIAVDRSGFVYVAGTCIDTVTNLNYITIKYGGDGQTVWERKYHGEAYDVAVDNHENIYVTGVSYGGSTNLDYATIKYEPLGDTVWVRRYSTPGNYWDEACAMAVDSSHNVYVTGRSFALGTYYDYATMKYYANGSTAWVNRYDGLGAASDQAASIALDGHGNVYVTGCSEGGDGNLDYVTIKYGKATAVSDEAGMGPEPSRIFLSQNYPNPFNPTTKIEFTLAKSGFVTLQIYDTLGRKVRTLVSEEVSSGYKSVVWDGKNEDGRDVASGVYFYQLKVGDFSEPKKMLLLK
ncbi:MAG: SBBP repeat-containing protein [Candidatus Zixiibacteriota bacterium]